MEYTFFLIYQYLLMVTHWAIIITLADKTQYADNITYKYVRRQFITFRQLEYVLCALFQDMSGVVLQCSVVFLLVV